MLHLRAPLAFPSHASVLSLVHRHHTQTIKPGHVMFTRTITTDATDVMNHMHNRIVKLSLVMKVPLHSCNICVDKKIYSLYM